MKQLLVRLSFVAVFAGAVACGHNSNIKNNDGNTADHQGNTYTAPETPHQDSSGNQAHPEVSSDQVLQDKLTEIVKDFDGVQANVHNGEVALMGKISRDRLPKLMQSVQALHPKKVENKMVIN